MFAPFKCVQNVSRLSLVRTITLTQCCFSEDQFVSKSRFLEKLKACDGFPKEYYENGKYLFFLDKEKVCLSDNKLLYLGYEDVQKWEKYIKSKIVLLNVLPQSNSHVCLFAVDLKSSNDDSANEIENGGKGTFVSVRQCMFFLSNEETLSVTHARGLLHFCQSFKYCNFCGGSLKENESGHRKQCSKCSNIQYPVLSPVGLTLIEDVNHQEVLLVRQKRHPPGMYTCVAGFVEPGESLEENAKREVAEEVGVKVDKVEYCTSQHWALPASQLALGCIGTTSSKEFSIDANEIMDAKWVNAKTLKDAIVRTRQLRDLNAMDPQKLWAPPSNAVSHSLMVIWLRKYHNFDASECES